MSAGLVPILLLLPLLSQLTYGQQCANLPQVNLLIPPKEQGPDYLAEKEACFANLGTTRGGKRGQKFRYTLCDDQSGTIRCNGGYKYQLDEIKVSGAALADKGTRLVLFRGSKIKMCMFGRIDARFASSAKLQLSVHGKVGEIDNISNDSPLDFIEGAINKLKDAIGIQVPFCDIKVDTCNEDGTTCQKIKEDPTSDVPKNFCSCTTINVPNVPGEKIPVETTLKALESPDEPDLATCEEEFEIDDLKRSKNKNTLLCIKIPSILGRARTAGRR